MRPFLLLLSMDLSDPFVTFKDILKGWWDNIWSKLPEALIALFTLILFYLIGRLIAKLFNRVLPKISKNKAVNRLIASMASITVVIIGLFAALSILDLDKTVTSLLAGVGILGLALGFAFQNAAANILSGVIMAVQSPINVGDIIKSNGHFGEVNHIGLRATRLTNPYGQEVEIPNRLVLQEPFEHYTYHGARRVDIECRVPFDADLQKVREAITKTVREEVDEALKDHPVQLFFMEYGDFSLEFEVRCWVRYNGRMTDYFEGRSEVVIAIQRALDGIGVEVPVPPRALRFPEGLPSSDPSERG